MMNNLKVIHISSPQTFSSSMHLMSHCFVAFCFIMALSSTPFFLFSLLDPNPTLTVFADNRSSLLIHLLFHTSKTKQNKPKQTLFVSNNYLPRLLKNYLYN